MFDDSLLELALRMAVTMRHANGIGLAAPQVGRSIRLVVVQMDGSKEPPRTLVNPVITKAADYQQSREGCLSVDRSQWGQAVSRRKRITVEFQDLDGSHKRFKAAGPVAACIQHEIDHLDGVLFTDYLPRPRFEPQTLHEQIDELVGEKTP